MDWGHVNYLWITIMFLLAVWTIILTAPSHWRWFIGDAKTKTYGLYRFLFHMLIDGLKSYEFLVDYRNVFISSLDYHSDGTHSLQRIHWWASDAMLYFSKNKLSTSLMACGWAHFQQIFIFGWTIPFFFSCTLENPDQLHIAMLTQTVEILVVQKWN